MSAPQITTRIEEMARQQRCPSLKAMARMFDLCESAEHFSAAIRARKQMYIVARHICSGSELPISADIAWKVRFQSLAGDAFD